MAAATPRTAPPALRRLNSPTRRPIAWKSDEVQLPRLRRDAAKPFVTSNTDLSAAPDGIREPEETPLCKPPPVERAHLAMFVEFQYETAIEAAPLR